MSGQVADGVFRFGTEQVHPCGTSAARRSFHSAAPPHLFGNNGPAEIVGSDQRRDANCSGSRVGITGDSMTFVRR